jgi:hypothetical protein
MRKTGLEHFYEASAFTKLAVFKGTPIENTLRHGGALGTGNGKPYLGTLSYRLQDQSMRRAYPIVRKLSRACRSADGRVKAMFGDPRAGSAEMKFGAELRIALSRSFLRLLTTLLTSRNARPSCSRIEARLRDVLVGLSQVETAKADGAFARLEPRSFDFGDFALYFPNAEIAQLGARLFGLGVTRERGIRRAGHHLR